MSKEEFSSILKTFYGEDLGYNSDDADCDSYLKLKPKSRIQLNKIRKQKQACIYINTNSSFF